MISRQCDMTKGLRYARTLREAFGPDARLEPQEEPTWGAFWIVAAVIVAVLVAGWVA